MSGSPIGERLCIQNSGFSCIIPVSRNVQILARAVHRGWRRLLARRMACFMRIHRESDVVRVRVYLALRGIPYAPKCQRASSTRLADYPVPKAGPVSGANRQHCTCVDCFLAQIHYRYRDTASPAGYCVPGVFLRVRMIQTHRLTFPSKPSFWPNWQDLHVEC